LFAGSFGTLPAYEVRVLIEKYRLGANTIIVPLNSINDRMIGTQRGTIDATVVPAPNSFAGQVCDGRDLGTADENMLEFYRCEANDFERRAARPALAGPLGIVV